MQDQPQPKNAQRRMEKPPTEQSAYKQRELAFYQQHKYDSDEELLAYLRDVAAKLGKVPDKSNVPGSAYLKGRFGPWPRILEKAGLKTPKPKSDRWIKKREKYGQQKQRRYQTEDQASAPQKRCQAADNTNVEASSR